MAPSGILVLHKPTGMTSHDCVYRIRKLFQTKKVGHTGTLDPEVDGVLPICLGKATKVVPYMIDFSKTYRGQVTLGLATTTEDRTGDVIERKEVTSPISRAQLTDVLSQFLGEQTQIPPYYSAVKVNGKKLYEYARAGLEVERPVRQVIIHQLALQEMAASIHEGTYSFSFEVTCSKGTYVRTLAVDIGTALGYPAHMSQLTRTSSGPFQAHEAITFSQLEEATLDERVAMLRPFDLALQAFPRVQASVLLEQKIRNGAVLQQDASFGSGKFLFYNQQGTCLALYTPHPTKIGLVKPERLFCQGEEEETQ
ncbi:tRNA pseudouridine(55) synthase TruB [Shouchella lonarensis]|uniref:tRNA pseudouridine synthase B n=1 Tax=Shouchella lonarensis TaxID=1464122 RepID=A0A1G6H8A2_9BACI|nr:tRNA pseudouridine(55) synthase TruB [Shouchella lonarensis]SDB90318.1 tRNA pseudouridine synthase B [Shouchella lonarensis]